MFIFMLLLTINFSDKFVYEYRSRIDPLFAEMNHFEISNFGWSSNAQLALFYVGTILLEIKY